MRVAGMCSSSQATAGNARANETRELQAADFLNQSETPLQSIHLAKANISSDGLGDVSGDAARAAPARLRETSEKLRVPVSAEVGLSSHAKDETEMPGTPKTMPSEPLMPFGSPFHCSPTFREVRRGLQIPQELPLQVTANPPGNTSSITAYQPDSYPPTLDDIRSEKTKTQMRLLDLPNQIFVTL